jgi:hypothetical protein
MMSNGYVFIMEWETEKAFFSAFLASKYWFWKPEVKLVDTLVRGNKIVYLAHPGIMSKWRGWGSLLSKKDTYNDIYSGSTQMMSCFWSIWSILNIIIWDTEGKLYHTVENRILKAYNNSKLCKYWSANIFLAHREIENWFLAGYDYFPKATWVEDIIDAKEKLDKLLDTNLSWSRKAIGKFFGENINVDRASSRSPTFNQMKTFLDNIL